MRRLTGLLVICLAAPSLAHVAPSEDANNRYLKLTATADRVRLAYTVFMGQRPGARERARLDRDRDGALSEAEAEVFRDRLAEEVRGALEVRIDGRAVPVTWAQRHIGLGTPTTAAGAFSVDLVAWLCFPAPGGRHTVTLRDRFRLADPGDTEIRVEESPGVRVLRSELASARQSMLDFKWVGAATYLQDGLLVEVEVGADAVPGDTACSATAAPFARGRTIWPWTVVGVVAGALIGLLVPVIVIVVRKRKRKR